MKACFGLIERVGEDFEAFVVMFSGEVRKITIEYLNDEFGDIGGLALLFLWFLDQEWKYSFKRLYELTGA